MTETAISYRRFLKELLLERQQRNARYSLRSFARQIGMSPSSLSELLSGKKSLSITRAQEISRRLSMSDRDKKKFVSMVTFEKVENSEDLRAELETIVDHERGSRKERVKFELAKFSLIAEWYHQAILGWLEAEEGVWDLDAASEGLQVSKQKLSKAMQNLLLCGLVEKRSETEFEIREDVCISSRASDRLIQNFLKDMLKKAEASLKDFSPNERMTATETFAFPLDKLAQAEEEFDLFIQKLKQLSVEGESKRFPFHMSCHFFPLTKNKTIKEKS